MMVLLAGKENTEQYTKGVLGMTEEETFLQQNPLPGNLLMT